MRLEHLARAVELEKTLQLWRDAESRAQPSVFKSARLIVSDMAHGYVPVPGQPAQSTEVIIQLTSDVLLPFIQAQKQRVLDELVELGVTL